jgi:ADP-ribose pyrophosphatase
VTPPFGKPFELHELIVQDGDPGAVIIAVNGGSIVFVNHYRPALDKVVVELPRGFADATDTESLKTGVREFSEELGMTLTHPRLIGEYILDTAIFPTRVGVVTGNVDVHSSARETDGEIQSWKLIPLCEVNEHIRSGEISDGHTLSALSLFFASREN